MKQPVVLYSHRARPITAPVDHALTDKGLAIRQDTRELVLPWSDIRSITLTYRPRNTTHEGYQMLVRGPKRMRATLSNLSWKSLVEFDRQDAEYVRFVRALVERAAAANPQVALIAGLPRWRYIAFIVAGVAAVGAMVSVMVAALFGEPRNLPLAAFAGALAAYFVWWSARFLTRNRPRRFTPDSLPADVLPRVT
jgi:hypothetical protein